MNLAEICKSDKPGLPGAMGAVRGPALAFSFSFCCAPCSADVSSAMAVPLRVGPIAGGTPALQTIPGRDGRDPASSRSRARWERCQVHLRAMASQAPRSPTNGPGTGSACLEAIVARRLPPPVRLGASDAPPQFVRRIVRGPRCRGCGRNRCAIPPVVVVEKARPLPQVPFDVGPVDQPRLPRTVSSQCH